MIHCFCDAVHGILVHANVTAHKVQLLLHSTISHAFRSTQSKTRFALGILPKCGFEWANLDNHPLVCGHNRISKDHPSQLIRAT